MQCPFCGRDNDKVVDSRASEGGRVIRRRRHCLACDRRYTTYEHPEEKVRLRVIKKDGSREPYNRQKVIDGLQKACSKRPVSDEEIRRIVEAAEEDIFRNFERDVPSHFIGDVVGGHLRNVDKIAYVRFASVYRQFTELGELIDEAKRAEQTATAGPQQQDLFVADSPPPQTPHE